MSTEADHQAKVIADFLANNGLRSVRVHGDTVSYPVANGHVILKVSTTVRPLPPDERTDGGRNTPYSVETTTP